MCFPHLHNTTVRRMLKKLKLKIGQNDIFKGSYCHCAVVAAALLVMIKNEINPNQEEAIKDEETGF